MASESKKTVIAAQFNDAATAQIAAGMLEDNGIYSAVSSSIMGTIYGAGSTWAPVDLYVRAEDLEEARRLLKEHGDI